MTDEHRVTVKDIIDLLDYNRIDIDFHDAGEGVEK